MTALFARSDTLRAEPAQGPGVSAAVALLTLVALAIVVLLTEWLARTLEAQPGAGTLHELTWWDIGFALIEHVLILVGALLATRLSLGRIRANDFGLRRVPWRAAIANAAMLYSVYLVVSAALFAIVGTAPRGDKANALAAADSGSVLICYALVACVLAPPTEELLFRGVLFAALRRRLGTVAAASVAGGLFGALHGPPLGSMLDLALLGVTLCLLYDRTKSLLPCVAVHAVHNSIAFGAIVSLSPLTIIALTTGATLLAVAATWTLAATLHKTEVQAQVSG